ncbi:alpha/beta hydrolase [Streptomyces showdoensis]|uniref:alpha/beta hydrolase n=1 Tax=Streptomyces showdoensis TaxID=68268 RepID=UPI001F0B6F43|nr:alpha/beta hydrolase-fold protein [Streptomyces showdoensis]
MIRRSTTPLAFAAIGVVLLATACSQGDEHVRFGDKPSATQRSSAPAARESTVRMPSNPRDWTTQRTLDNGTKVVWTELKGPKSGFTGKVWAWVPKQYDEEKYRNSAFPVLIALPGSNGYPTNYWFGADLKLQETIQQAADEGKGLPFIVVMPVLNASDKDYWDGSDIPGQPKMGTWMSDDVPDLARENFRTYKDPRGWGFFGSSSGGYVGMKMVLQYPGRFGSAIAGGPDTEPTSPFWAGHDKERKANDPGYLASRLIAKGGPKVNISIMLGTKESGQAATKAFVKKYDKGPVAMRLHVIQNGRHSGRQYAESLTDGPLEWISKRMLAPEPSE